MTRTFQLTTASASDTFGLGQKIGERLTGGLTIALIGDLGSGKTVFVQGLGRGLAVPDDCYIVSPSYTLINEYPGRLPLFHVDLYRLSHPDEIEDIGLLDWIDPAHVVAIEWADRFPDILPPDHLSLRFTLQPDDRRIVTLTAHGVPAVTLLQQLQQSTTTAG